MTKKKPPSELKKRGKGHPPKPYYPDRHPEWVRGMASRGSTVQEICTAMGVSRGTLYAWKKAHPDFLAALSVGRNETVSRLRLALHKRAEGFTKPSIEQKIIEHPDGTTTKQVIKKDEYFPPDVAALKVSLVNLDPTFKTERTESEITGRDGKPIKIEWETVGK